MNGGGGYDDGYNAVPCFWGAEPGSLVKFVVADCKLGPATTVLDIGCGEGKNAAAFANLGCQVSAVDCSARAISNGRTTFADLQIQWLNQDALKFDFSNGSYDIIISYGLFHCISSIEEIAILIDCIQKATTSDGLNIICTFNNRSHDLSAHPGFRPTLMPHTWYVEQYRNWEITHLSDLDLFEIHPHNNIPHHHSMTRFIARKTQ